VSPRTTTLQLIAGKYYVRDRFDETDDVLGPFDSREAAEAEREQLNVADDCYTFRKGAPRE
jgi:hypothetical protein